MRTLDKNKVYDLSELTSEELKELSLVIEETNSDKRYVKTESWLKSFSERGYKLLFRRETGWSFERLEEDFINAKELFYTLENIQVDCSELTEEQIKEMCKVYESDGYKQWIDPEAFIIIDNFTYLRIDSENEFYITGGLDTKNTITYDKFMELFGRKEENFKKLVEVLNEELTEESFKKITNSIADLLIYKNSKYGNSALNPLDIFNGKSKVGQRIDDKLARVKNSKELRKNDIADLLGYLTLVCQENNWTNFDEFKD